MGHGEALAQIAVVGRKCAGEELERGPAIPALDAFLGRELVRLGEGIAIPPQGANEVAGLDALLWDAVMGSATERNPR